MSSTSSTDCPFCRTPMQALSLPDMRCWRCPDCGCIRKDERHHPDTQAEKRRYDLHAAVPDAGYVEGIAGFLETAVLPWKRQGTALDFGAGRTGVATRLLQEAGFDVAAYDPFYLPDVAPLSRIYDVVVAIEVVEHFRDPARAWDRLVGLVAPGGILAVSTRRVPEADFSAWWYRRDPTHLCFYTDAAFRRIAARYGLAMLTLAGEIATFGRR